MVKIGVAGLGKMGISHFSIVNSHPEAEVMVCDTSKTRARRGRPLSPACRIWRDYDAMLDEAGLDAVIIATPSRLHAPDGEEGAGARPARLLREAVLPRLARSPRSWPRLAAEQRARSTRWATTTATSAPSRR